MRLGRHLRQLLQRGAHHLHEASETVRSAASRGAACTSRGTSTAMSRIAAGNTSASRRPRHAATEQGAHHLEKRRQALHRGLRSRASVLHCTGTGIYLHAGRSTAWCVGSAASRCWAAIGTPHSEERHRDRDRGRRGARSCDRQNRRLAYGVAEAGLGRDSTGGGGRLTKGTESSAQRRHELLRLLPLLLSRQRGFLAQDGGGAGYVRVELLDVALQRAELSGEASELSGGSACSVCARRSRSSGYASDGGLQLIEALTQRVERICDWSGRSRGAACSAVSRRCSVDHMSHIGKCALHA